MIIDIITGTTDYANIVIPGSFTPNTAMAPQCIDIATLLDSSVEVTEDFSVSIESGDTETTEMTLIFIMDINGKTGLVL